MKPSLLKPLIAFGLLIAGTTTLATVVISRVSASARALAGNLPYCIQIPGDGDYVEAKTKSDISPFRMVGSGGNHHAVLIVGNENDAKYYHWSYWSHSFVEGVYGLPPIYCKPQQRFLDAMPLPAKDPIALRFYFVGRHFSVQRTYYPSVNWASRQALVFYAAAPDFLPSPDRKELGSYIDIVFGKGPLLPSWLSVTNDSYLVDQVDPEFGLQKQQVWHRTSSAGPKGKFSSTQYFQRIGKGEVTTLISCNSGNCTHIFEQDGWSFYFHHTTERLPEWKSMQAKLSTVAHSFVVSE